MPAPEHRGQIALVVEELTPVDPVVPTLRRVERYLRSGVELMCLIDWHDRSITIYRRRGGFNVVMGSDHFPEDLAGLNFRGRVSDFFRSSGPDVAVNAPSDRADQ
jgi:hypothetical protein